MTRPAAHVARAGLDRRLLAGGLWMRALGPGSVSSFLKIILDVVYATLWIVLGLAVVGMFASLLFSFNPDLLPRNLAEADARQWTLRAEVLFASALVIAGVQVIVDALRRIFMTLTAGDPFHPQNVRRLRLIGFMLALLEIGNYVFWGLTPLMPAVRRVSGSFNVTAWFSVLVVFVLAEVFREGARLRREAELTI
jgi:hypothetical protein